MNIDRLPMNMLSNDGVEIAYLDEGPRNGIAVLLIHGFASNAHVNWVFTGWVKSLTDAGFRVIALDNRGHGASQKLHDTARYTPVQMASDALSLLAHLAIGSAHVMGYSMGARLSTFVALAEPGLVRTLTLGGLGSGLTEGVGDWDPIAAALLAPSIDDVMDERGRTFRNFADQTHSDRLALAACIKSSRTLVTQDQLKTLVMPTLVAVGTRDDIGGSPHKLADMLPNGQAFDIENRDHMLAVGDRSYKAAVLAFYGDYEAS